jgi:MoaA/NifB/PqqE/SkfB family radical SAM enzyme
MTDESMFRREGIGSGRLMLRLESFLMKKFNLSESDYRVIVDYLNDRSEQTKGKGVLGIVYVITLWCNLDCVHCGANACLTNMSSRKISFETTTDQVKTILSKIKEYANAKSDKGIFLMFGGGEPTLRPDLKEVLIYASKLFGAENIGFNTNGTTMSANNMLDLEEYVGMVEISLDDLEAYHNQWRDPKRQTSVSNPFKKTLALISDAVEYDCLRQKLGVSSVITKDNLDKLPSFAKFLKQIKVKNYSIHRAMPVGRMEKLPEKIPDMRDYMRLLLTMSKIRNDHSSFSFHLHHSLESIYSALFLGRDMHQSNLLMGSGRHSIGIDPRGSVYFDPWGMVKPYDRLDAGNLLNSKIDLQHMVESRDGIIRLVDDTIKKKIRCKKCVIDCNGGSRFNALCHYILKLSGEEETCLDETRLLAGLAQIDPACPLYED